MESCLDKLRVGVIGVGRMGSLHIAKYSLLPGVEIVGVYDSNTTASQKAKEVFKVKAFENLNELLFEADAVSIATSTESHYRIARMAFEAGVHVLLEKPITETVDEALELVNLAKKHELVFQVGFVERFRYRELSKSLLPSKVLFVASDRLSSSVGRERQIDVISDLMIHDLDLALSLISEQPSTVSALGLAVITDCIDVANARLEFPGGSVVNLNASRVSEKPMRKFRVFSSDHYASIDFMNNNVVVARRGSDSKMDRLTINCTELDALRGQSEQFVDCVKFNRTPLVTGEDGLRALQAVENIRRQIDERIKMTSSFEQMGHTPSTMVPNQ